MNFELKIEPVKKQKNGEKDRYIFNLSTYKEKIQGVFDYQDLRYMIELIDNAIP